LPTVEKTNSLSGGQKPLGVNGQEKKPRGAMRLIVESKDVNIEDKEATALEVVTKQLLMKTTVN
jgi:hypothetical protein